MTYDEFRAAFMRALRESGLPGMGSAEETLDMRTLDRTLQVRVEPVGGQRTEPFYATATISWRWSALQTTRGIFREEDTLRELLGHDEDVDTERPSLRVDIHLAASTMVGKPVPMPTKQKWADWAREALGRLEGGEALLPEEDVQETEDGRLCVLAWKGDPRVEADCSPSGEVRLHAVRLEAFQMLELPRLWDDSTREPDDMPDAHLDAMFARVKASLFAWMDALDHLGR